MMISRLRSAVTVAAVLTAATHAVATALEQVRSQTPSLVLGLDHIPLAVSDLAAAAGHYTHLGFTLKPGRPHENGIRSQHVKFQDGTAIELITAAEPRDALTSEYRAHLAGGDGPAFVSLFAPDMSRLARHFGAEGLRYRRGDGLLSFPEGDSLRYVFFGGRKRSPTDRPEHFRHANGAEALTGVWLAGDGLAAERALLAGLGAAITGQDVCVPEAVRGAVATLPRGEIVLLPGSRQLVPGRKIVGATLRVQDLALLQRMLAQGRRGLHPAVQTRNWRSVFLPPDATHGIWLEFREAH